MQRLIIDIGNSSAKVATFEGDSLVWHVRVEHAELPELLGICDRILVMSNGRLAGIVERGKDFGDIPGEQETIMALAAKYV